MHQCRDILIQIIIPQHAVNFDLNNNLKASKAVSEHGVL